MTLKERFRSYICIYIYTLRLTTSDANASIYTKCSLHMGLVSTEKNLRFVWTWKVHSFFQFFNEQRYKYFVSVHDNCIILINIDFILWLRLFIYLDLERGIIDTTLCDEIFPKFRVNKYNSFLRNATLSWAILNVNFIVKLRINGLVTHFESARTTASIFPINDERGEKDNRVHE